MAKIKGLKYNGGRTRNRIVEYLSSHPGATSEDIAGALGIPEHNVQAALYTMNKVGLLTRWRVGAYFANMLRDAKPSQDVEDPELELLKARLVELEAFKAQAVEKHPDLAIDYEAYRPALLAFYKVWGMDAGDPFDDADKRYIDGIIAAAKVLPQ